jgi:hypothetical protein
MANEFKIKHGFISTGDGSVEGEIRITGAGYADNGQRIATRNWATQYLSDNSYATTTDISNAIDALVASAPGTLDTLNELAAALGDDPNFSTTVTNSIATKLPLAGGTMSGNIRWTSTDRGLEWVMNTDGAGIKFYNTGDADTNSRLEYYTTDNGNEYHRFMVATNEEMTIKSDGVRVTNNIYMAGNIVATQSWVSTRGYGQASDITAVNTRIDEEVLPLFDTKADVGHNHDGVYLPIAGKAADSELLDGINSTSFLRSDAADTASGRITFTGGINGFTNSAGISGNNFNITGVNELKINDPGEGINFHDKVILKTIDDATDNKIDFTGATEVQVNGAKLATESWVSTNTLNQSEGDARYDAIGAADDVNTRIDEEVLPAIPTNVSELTNDAGYITDGNTGWNNSYGFITASSTDTLTNKSGNISQWTNDSGYITGYTETDTLDTVADRGATTDRAITTGGITSTYGHFGGTGTNPQVRIYTENESASIADTFTDTTTDKSFIYFMAGTSSNDPGYIMHENSNGTSPDERNEGVLHLVPSDDNSTGDYVSIHGTNDPDCIKLHTSGLIETSSSYQLQLVSGSGSVLVSDALQVTGTVTAPTFSGALSGNANTASRLANARNIALSGAVTGNANFDGSGNITISTSATSDPTLTLAGDASGSATFTNLGNATLTVTVANDSHTHDGRYYTESESDARFVNVTGDTVTGDLAITGATLSVTSTAEGSEAFFVDGVNGRLFTISDDLSDSLFSANTISGLPVIEAFADNTVKLGPYSNPVIIDSSGNLSIGGTSAATESYVDTAITNLIGGAPGALDTLNELAAAINDDASFASSVTSSLALKAPLASPALTGNPTAPTQATSNNSTRIATTAFVKAQGYVTTDTNYYLNGISRSGNTLTFSVSGATNQTYTFGSAAWSATSAFDAAGSAAAVETALNTRIEEEVLPAIPTVPTNVSAFTNDAGYITDGNTNWNNSYGFITASDSITGNAATATTATNLGSHYTADNWFRATGDDNTVKFYGNSRMMVFRTDGEGGDTGHTGYAFKWTYGGDGTGSTRMLLDNNGNLWTSSYGWLHSRFETAGAAATVEGTLNTRIDEDVLPLIQTPAITSNGSTPSLNSGITAAEIRSLIGAGTSSSNTNYYLSGASFDTSNGVLTLTVTGATDQTVDLDGRYDLSGSAATVNDRIDNDVIPNIPTNNNQLTNGAGYITDGNTNWNNTYGFITNSVTDFYVADQIIHTGDTNTYMQFHAADQWRVVTGGGERLEVNNSQVTVQNALHVHGNILLTGSATTTNQGRMIDFTGFDKEGTTDFSDRAYIQHTTNTGGHAGSVLVISSQNDSGDGIAFLTNASSKLKHNSNNIATENWVTSQSYLTTSGKAADSNLLDGLDSSAFLRSNTGDTASGHITFSAGISTLSINDTSNQQLVICAGEAGIDASQTGELVYVNAENGFQVAASNDNWATGYAGTKKTIIDYGGIRYDGNYVWHAGNFNPANYQPAGTYNTIIGTDSDINTSGSTIIDNIYVTDGVITSMGTRTLTAANLGIAKPAPPTFGAANVVGETIEVVFDQSPTSGVDYYQVWSSVAGGAFGMITQIPTQDIAATMTAIDADFAVAGTHEYRIYAIKNGIYSDPAEGGVTFNSPTLDVVNLSVVNLNTAYYIQYDMPDSRFVDHIEIYMDAETSSGSLSRTGASLIYSGNNTSYMYQIGASDLDKFHQFWVEVVES